MQCGVPHLASSPSLAAFSSPTSTRNSADCSTTSNSAHGISPAQHSGVDSDGDCRSGLPKPSGSCLSNRFLHLSFSRSCSARRSSSSELDSSDSRTGGHGTAYSERQGGAVLGRVTVTISIPGQQLQSTITPLPRPAGPIQTVVVIRHCCEAVVTVQHNRLPDRVYSTANNHWQLMLLSKVINNWTASSRCCQSKGYSLGQEIYSFTTTLHHVDCVNQ